VFFLNKIGVVMNFLKWMFVFLCLCNQSWAQKQFTVKGVFPNAKEKEVQLVAYYGAKDSVLVQTKTDSVGTFSMVYPRTYRGAAALQITGGASVILLLNAENLVLKWDDFTAIKALKISDSPENNYFLEAYGINDKAEKKRAALEYLKPLYDEGTKNSDSMLKLITEEITLNKNSLTQYIAVLPKDCYAKQYLMYRQFLQDLQQAKKNPEQVSSIVQRFAGINLGSADLYQSGMVKGMFDDYLEMVLKHYKEDEVVAYLDQASDHLIADLKNQPKVLNEYTEYVFKLYEKYGKTKAAEHLALSLLLDNKCSIDGKRSDLFEQYRKMAVGATAPDLSFSNCNKAVNRLSEIKSKYKVIVFGASWCEECKKEIPQIEEYVIPFKANYDAEIIFIALDTDKAGYESFTKNFTFTTSCDMLSWESPNVKKYHVFATPTYFVLDDKNTILAKPNSSIAAATFLYELSKDH
jgi:thiol-disulfide isomerase/thioredoxin